MEWIHSLKNIKVRDSNPDGVFCGITGLCVLGSIICVLLSMGKDKNHLQYNLMVRD